MALESTQFSNLQNLQIRNFSSCIFGNYARLNFTIPQNKKRLLNLFLFPCGHFLDDKEDVYFMLTYPTSEMLFHDDISVPKIEENSLAITVSIVDVDGVRRSPQCFTKEDFLYGDEDLRLARIIRKQVLLDSKEEILPSDILTVQFEVSCRFQISFEKETSMKLNAPCKCRPSEEQCNSKKWFELQEQFFQPQNFSDIFCQLQNLDSIWTDEDFIEELQKRQKEIAKFLTRLWRKFFFCINNDRHVESLLPKFLSIMKWVDLLGTAVPFARQETHWFDLFHERHLRPKSLKKIYEDMLSVTGDTMGNAFKWNKVFHQKFQENDSLSVPEWHYRFEELRFQTIVALEKHLTKLFQFQSELQDINKEKKYVPDLGELVRTKIYNFLTISTQDGKDYPMINERDVDAVSKLCDVSPVFDRMLRTPMLERLTRKVKLENIDSVCFENLLDFVVTNQLKPDTLNGIVDLYEAADQFEIKSLMHTCAEYLACLMTTENIEGIRNCALLHSDQHLLKLANNFMNAQTLYHSYCQ